MTRLNSLLAWSILAGISLLLAALISHTIADNLMHTRVAVSEIQATSEKLSRLEMLIDAIPIGVILVDEDGIVRYANEGLQNLCEKSRKEIVGQSFTFLMPEKYREKHVRMFNDPVFRAGPSASHQCIPQGKLLRSDGSTITLPIFIHRNRISGHYEWIVYFDTTDMIVDKPRDSVPEPPGDASYDYDQERSHRRFALSRAAIPGRVIDRQGHIPGVPGPVSSGAVRLRLQ